jgi:hypothetical protein
MIMTLPLFPVTAIARSTAPARNVFLSPEAEAPSAAVKNGTPRNCFGFFELLAGQSLVPEPPAMITQSSNIFPAAQQ